MGDPRRRVHLLHFQPGHVDGHRALLRGPGRREEHRPAEPEAVRQFRPDPAGRFAAAGEAALHRRRADPGADALEQALRRFRAAPHRRPGARRHQAGAGRLRGDADRRPAARDPHRARRGQARGLQPLAAAGGRRARALQPAPALRRVRHRQPRVPARNRRVSAHRRRRAQRGGRGGQRQAGLRARRRRGDRWRRGAVAVRAHGACRLAASSCPP